LERLLETTCVRPAASIGWVVTRRGLTTGVAGQDGLLLAELLRRLADEDVRWLGDARAAAFLAASDQG
jgi:hypothetical protein